MDNGNSLNMDCLHDEVEMNGVKSRQDKCECSEGYELIAANVGTKYPCTDKGKWFTFLT